MQKIRFNIIFLVLMPLTVLTADNNIGRGGYAGSYMRMGLGAKAMAMGGGSPAIAMDGTIPYYNPAGTGMLQGRFFTAALHNMALDRRIAYFGYAQSIIPSGEGKDGFNAGFAIGWLNAGIGSIDGRDFAGNHTKDYSSAEHCFYFSFSIQPSSFISVGLSAKLFMHRFPDMAADGSALSAKGFGLDFGLLVNPFDNLTFGLSLQDLGSGVTWDTQDLFRHGSQKKDHFPKHVRFGASWNTMDENFLVHASMHKVEFMPWAVSAGFQYMPLTDVFIRGGMAQRSPTFGAGMIFSTPAGRMHIDYAFVHDPIAPSANHLLTWSLVF